MICPKCGSLNVNIQAVAEQKKRGFFSILMWIILALFTCGLVLLIPLLSRKSSKTQSYAVCQNCGHKWLPGKVQVKAQYTAAPIQQPQQNNGVDFKAAYNKLFNKDTADTPKTEQSKKPFYQKWWFWVIIAVLVMALIGSTVEDTEPEQPNNDTSSVETVLPDDSTDTKPEANNKYLTKTEWAMYDSNYMFAVEVDSFDGDIFKAGTYTFTLKAGITKSAAENGGIAKLPMVFDVYIADKEYSSLAQIYQDFNSPTLTIGGMSSNNVGYEYTLNKGQYVYVVPAQDLLYEPSGYLTIKLK